MHIWASMLTELPPTLQCLIARSQRISLPRRCPAPERHARLRAALCRARVVRATYFGLPREVQAALQELRATPRGLSPADLAARYGPLRPWSQLQQDRRPQSISEQLVLLGWLLPRPATPRHPARFLLPPELRAWLPRPLALPVHGLAPAPNPSTPLALRAATTLLLASAEQPLPVRRDGTLRAASLRRLLPRLAPLAPAAATALCRFILPLLIDLGLLAPHGTAAALAPAGARFLALPPDRQLTQLTAAWIAAPREDAWLIALCRERRGIVWPCLRRRLLAWAEALPPQRLLDPAALYGPLAQALGPLADAQTHGLRRVDRAPWQPKRAAAIWQAALRGPLTWLGVIAWAEEPSTHCFATGQAASWPADDDAADPPPLAAHHTPTWRSGTVGEVIVPHTAAPHPVLRLLPYAQWQAADATTTVYRITPRTLAAAMRQGYTTSALRALLTAQAGAVPAAWEPLLAMDGPPIRIVHTAVVTSADPAVLSRATRQRSVRRYLATTLAPGIALVEPQRAAPLARALTRQHIGVAVAGHPVSAPPAAFSPAECATLLAACAGYRQQVPDGAVVPLLPVLEERLQASLPPSLHGRVDVETQPPEPPPAPSAPPLPWPVVPPPERPAVAPPSGTVERVAGSARRAAAPIALWTLLTTLLLRLLPGIARPQADEPATEARPPAPDAPAPPVSDAAPVIEPRAYLPVLRQAIARRRLVEIQYTARDAPVPTRRIVRPVQLESHGDRWYLHAYCTLSQAECCFRLDRISALLPLPAQRQRGGRCRSAPAVRPAPRQRGSAVSQASFFPPPPQPPPGSPLVRVWLA